MSDPSLDDLLNDINSSSNKKGGKKKGGAAAAKNHEPIKQEIEVQADLNTNKEVNKIDNDDLLNELESIPNKKGKKKAASKSNAKQEVKEPEIAIEEKSVEPTTNDDLLDDLNSMPSKKKGKGKQPAKEQKEVKQPEPVKEEINQANLEQPAEEANDEGEEEGEGKGEEKADEGEKKKKKKVIKKVKKLTKEDKFLKLIQEQAKKKKEIEDRLQREAEEEERRRQEEEEIQRKLDEEIKRQEDLEKQIEIERLESLKSRGIKAADLKKLDLKKQQTEEELKKQGFVGGLDEFLKSIPTRGPIKKKPGKKAIALATAQKKQEEEYVEKEEVNEEEVDTTPNEELLKHAEAELSIKINTDNDDLDWEDFDENKVEDKPKKVSPPKVEIQTIKVDVSKDVSTTDSKKQRAKPKEKKPIMEEEPEYVPTARLRSPVICILGHVDTGKTKILDKLRRTNVQEGEAGGITQQIGATFFPIENFTQHAVKIPEKFRIEPKIPGFLIIDTPGHESFQNLRVRGSSLCDLAVLVVDVMHGLEKQTIDSIELLRRRRTPFIIAFNKIDRIYQWKSTEWGGFRDSFDVQKKNQTREFNDRVNKIIMQLVQNNLNVALYDENPSMKEYINIVPTSAVTGEGMPDLIAMFIYIGQKFLMKKLEYKEEVQCTILEVKVLEGTGTTIDVILVNGTLKVGDKIIIGGLFGPIKTTIKILLTPHPMKEMRIKSEYQHHDSISGAIGIKIFATDLDNALAGSPLFVYKSDEEAEKHAREITQDFNSIISDYISKTGKGIMVQASTLGSLEAILTYLHDKKIEIAAVGLGNLQKKDIIKLKTIHSKEDNPLKEYLTILAFDIKISHDVQQLADESGIKIFSADVIYHLFDSYVLYEQQCKEERKKEKLKEAVFPCLLKIVPNAIFNRKDPIIIGVDVTEGILKVGTPLYIIEKKLPLGVVEGIESNKKQVNNVRPKDGSVAIRIKPADTGLTVGRQFEETDIIASHISRNSINSLKEFFRDDMTKEDWGLIVQLKKAMEII